MGCGTACATKRRDWGRGIHDAGSMTPDVAIRLDALLADMRGIERRKGSLRLAFERRLRLGTATEADVQTAANWILDRIGHEHG